MRRNNRNSYNRRTLRGLGEVPSATDAGDVDTTVIQFDTQTAQPVTGEENPSGVETAEVELPVSGNNGYINLSDLRASANEDIDLEGLLSVTREAGFATLVESYTRANFDSLNTDTKFEPFLRKEGDIYKFSCALNFSYSKEAISSLDLGFQMPSEVEETLAVLYFNENIQLFEPIDGPLKDPSSDSLVLPLTTEGLTLETIASNNDFSLLNTLTADVIKMSFGQAYFEATSDQSIDLADARDIGALCIGLMMSNEDQKASLLGIIEQIMGSVEFAKHLFGFNLREEDLFSTLVQASKSDESLVELVSASKVSESRIGQEPEIAALVDKALYVSRSRDISEESLNSVLIETFDKIFRAIAGSMKDSVIDNLRISSIDIVGRLAKFEANLNAAFVNIKTLYNVVASDNDKKQIEPEFRFQAEDQNNVQVGLNSAMSEAFASMYLVSDLNTDLRKLIKLSKFEGSSYVGASYTPGFKNLVMTTATLITREFEGSDEETKQKFLDELKKRVRVRINNELNKVFTLMDDCRANAAYHHDRIVSLLDALEKVNPVSEPMVSFKAATLEETVRPVANNLREVTDRFMVACDAFSETAEDAERDFLISIGQLENARKAAEKNERTLSPVVRNILYSLAGAAIGYGVRAITVSRDRE